VGLGKKAVIVSMIAILLATLFVLIFSPRYERSLEDATAITTTRVRAMNTYVTDLQTMTELLLEQMTTLTFRSLYNYTLENETQLQDVEAAFESCILYDNFTNYGETWDCIFIDEPLPAKLNRITMIADEPLHLTTNYTISNLSVWQEHPFDVTINYTSKYNLTDNYTAIWRGEQNKTVTISIIGMSDPLFAIHSGGLYERNITWTDIKDGQWRLNTTFFEKFYNESDYRINRFGAPSYLKRFENDLSASFCCGIETLLNTTIYPYDEFANLSYVAYQYWGVDPMACEDTYTINIWPFDGSYVLDEEHVAVFELWNVSTTLC